jgi:hypothetical protein
MMAHKSVLEKYAGGTVVIDDIVPKSIIEIIGRNYQRIFPEMNTVCIVGNPASGNRIVAGSHKAYTGIVILEIAAFDYTAVGIAYLDSGVDMSYPAISESEITDYDFEAADK